MTFCKRKTKLHCSFGSWKARLAFMSAGMWWKDSCTEPRSTDCYHCYTFKLIPFLSIPREGKTSFPASALFKFRAAFLFSDVIKMKFLQTIVYNQSSAVFLCSTKMVFKKFKTFYYFGEDTCVTIFLWLGTWKQGRIHQASNT